LKKIRFITFYKRKYALVEMLSLEFSSLCQSSNVLVESTGMNFWTEVEGLARVVTVVNCVSFG
jgi:hypothetical protein